MLEDRAQRRRAVLTQSIWAVLALSPRERHTQPLVEVVPRGTCAREGLDPSEGKELLFHVEHLSSGTRTQVSHRAYLSDVFHVEHVSKPTLGGALELWHCSTWNSLHLRGQRSCPEGHR